MPSPENPSHSFNAASLPPEAIDAIMRNLAAPVALSGLSGRINQMRSETTPDPETNAPQPAPSEANDQLTDPQNTADATPSADDQLTDPRFLNSKVQKMYEGITPADSVALAPRYLFEEKPFKPGPEPIPVADMPRPITKLRIVEDLEKDAENTAPIEPAERPSAVEEVKDTDKAKDSSDENKLDEESDDNSANNNPKPDYRTQPKKIVATRPESLLQGPDPENSPHMLLQKIKDSQKRMTHVRNSENTADIGYDRHLVEHSQKFFDSLVNEAMDQFRGRVPIELVPAGYDMIDRALVHGRVPTLRELTALREIVLSQGLEQMTAYNHDQNGGIDSYRLDMAKKYAVYENKFNKGLIMHNDPNVVKTSDDDRWSHDSVSSVFEHIDLDTWLWDEAQTQYASDVRDVYDEWHKENKLPVYEKQTEFKSQKYFWNRMARRYDKPEIDPKLTKEQTLAKRIKTHYNNLDVRFQIKKANLKEPRTIMHVVANDLAQSYKLNLEIREQKLKEEIERTKNQSS